MSEEIFVLFFKGKPIHETKFFSTDRYGKLRAVRLPKKMYTRLGYAKNGVRNLPACVDKTQVLIMEYKPDKEIDWRIDDES